MAAQPPVARYALNLLQDVGGELLLLKRAADVGLGRSRKLSRLCRMDGIDENIAFLTLWPQRYLNRERVPAHLREP